MRESARRAADETRSVGKHVRPRSNRSRWTSVIAGAAVMGLLLAGVGWVAVNALSDADDTTGSDRRATATSSGAATTTDAERALAACRTHVAAQERVADAAAATARSCGFAHRRPAQAAGRGS